MTDFRDAIRQCARTDQYMLHPRALQRLADFLAETSSDQATAVQMIRDMFALLKKENLARRFVDEAKMAETIRKQITMIRGLVERDSASQVLVVQLPGLPKVTVDEISGDLKVGGGPAGAGAGAGVVEDRLHALRERYLLARRRCLRSGIYRSDMRPRLGDEKLLPLIPTTALEGLLPSVDIAVLGLLVAKGRDVVLEDIFAQTTLRPMGGGIDLSRGSFIGDGLLVVVVGRWRNAAIHVSRIDLPPAEKRDRTLAEIGPSLDLFGLAPGDMTAAFTAEKSALRSVVIVLAHVYLDKPATVAQLAFFFQRMQERSEIELADTTFVLAGNFSSTPLAYGDASHLPNLFGGTDRLHGLFDRLASCVVANSPTAAQHSHFVLVPGPHDMSVLQGFLPQCPIAAGFTRELRARLKRVTLAPNPCRLRFHTHEIVVCRRDFLRSFQERERSFPWTNSGTNGTSNAGTNASEEAGSNGGGGGGPSLTSFERIAKTVIDQAHLAPEEKLCTIWRLDDALRLPVLPHTLLLCDSTEQWECTYKGVHVVNPGSFAVSTTFLWYTPADGECSLSSLE